MNDCRCLAADGVVIRDGELFLLRRDHSPHEGDWVLPGGYVEPHETAWEACEREVREEIGVAVEATAFVGLYDDPGRDERGTVSAAYRCDVGEEPLAGGDEARDVGAFDPEEPPPLGFDHETILADALALTTGDGA